MKDLKFKLVLIVIVLVSMVTFSVYGIEEVLEVGVETEVVLDLVEVVEGVEMPVLMYHMFSEDEALCQYDTVVSPQKFRKDLRDLKEMGYTSILPKELRDMQRGLLEVPEKPVLITVDDGYLDNYELMFPVLVEEEMKATVFVIGWARGESELPNGGGKMNPHFSWTQAREMSESGYVSIQPHSYDLHWDKGVYQGAGRKVGEGDLFYSLRFMGDLKKIVKDIREYVGEVSYIYSYPFGEYSNVTESILKTSGFLGSVTVESGTAVVGEGFLMPRYNVSMVELLGGVLVE